MSEELWTPVELVRAAGGRLEGEPSSPISGFSIDTRTLRAGEVFVALKDARDGHEFVGNAFRAGAAAAVVAEGYARKPADGALIVVDDPLGALQRIGIAARARLARDARIFAVTGSVGKTTTKEMLRACFGQIAAAVGGHVHAADKSFNNHIGVPLTLARMPATTRYAVFEIGMNHAGEIAPLTRMVRPDIAIVTTVEAVHIENFASVAAIADAKAEIFAGLAAGGAAIIKRDNPHWQRLAAAAAARSARIVAFGADPSADARLVEIKSDAAGSDVVALIGGSRLAFRVGAPGRHLVENAVAVVAALDAAGLDAALGARALAGFGAPAGRGERLWLELPGGRALMIDESYNANPASMRAALTAMRDAPLATSGRRIAVLGEMLELGAEARALHEGLIDALDAAGIDLVFACGPNMRHLFDKLGSGRQGAWAERSEGLRAALAANVRAGDVIMLKGSNGARLGVLVEALRGLGAAAADRS